MNAKTSDREKRLAAALRENLKRRKARDRAEAGTPEPEPAPESAGRASSDTAS